ncbi:hypothetical protein [Nonomuraea basaltis]|nr:hypothetical protein [Nonomuraea basaltis]
MLERFGTAGGDAIGPDEHGTHAEVASRRAGAHDHCPVLPAPRR